MILQSGAVAVGRSACWSAYAKVITGGLVVQLPAQALWMVIIPQHGVHTAGVL